MKNLFKLATLVSIAAIVFLSGCKKDTNTPVYFEKMTFSSAESNYLGNIYRNNVNAFEAYFYDRNIGIDANGYFTGSGNFLFLDLNTNASAAAIPAGTYVVNNEDEDKSISFTFQRGRMVKNSSNKYVPSGSYIGIVSNGSITGYHLISSGKIVIKNTGDYSFTGQITDSENLPYDITFSGKIPVTDIVTPYPNTLTKGELWNWGDYDGVGLNIYSIRLRDKNLSADFSTGYGDRFVIEVYTPLTSTTGIPAGSYPVLVNNAQNQTVIDGYTDSNGENFGTWYYTADQFAIVSGTLNVTRGTGDNYTLNYTFKDDLGNPINGSFNGALTFVNKSAAAAPAAVKMQRSQSINTEPQDILNKSYNIRTHRGTRSHMTR